VSEIVSAMKSFAHPGQSSFEPVDINAGLRSTLIVSRNEWKYVAHVQEDLEPTLSHVSGLGGELHQVWLNLVVNAAQAIAEKVTGTSELGTITVSSRRIGDIVRIAIADTGPGIPEKARSRLFEPFFTTKPEGKGTGQGLPIAWDVVVNKHKGRLWFDTEEGVGTTFYVELPITDPEIEGIS
jgi:signal transduction histidine kinase